MQHALQHMFAKRNQEDSSVWVIDRKNFKDILMKASPHHLQAGSISKSASMRIPLSVDLGISWSEIELDWKP